jgi:hypothetical protein
MDPTATSYVRLGPRNELEVVGIDGRTYCRCGIATPQSTGFFPLPSHRAGVLLSQVPYLSTQRLSIESYATHKLRRLPPTACGLSGVHPTLDSRYAAIDDECGHTTVYDLRTGAVRARFTVPSASINDATAVPRDRFAFGDDHGNTYVFDADGREQFALVDGSAAVQGIAASADGSVIATVSSDGILRIWNGRTGLLMRRITTGEDLDSVGMAPDGSAVYTDTATGLIESFDTCPLCGNGRALLRASDQLAVRPLSKAERQAFGAAT